MENAGDIIRQAVNVVEHLRIGRVVMIGRNGMRVGQCRDGVGIVQE